LPRILRFGANELPDFVTLQTAHAEISHGAIMVGGTSVCQVEHEPYNGVLRNARHANG
jgi:hypothetical protein